MRAPRSCTYVPLKQRYDGYAKYAERIGYGLRAFAGLRRSIERNEWEAAAAAVDEDAGPTPARDILLKVATAPSTLPTHNRTTMCIALDLRISESIAERANPCTCPCLLPKQAALLNSQLLVSPNNLREARRIHAQCPGCRPDASHIKYTKHTARVAHHVWFLPATTCSANHSYSL